MVIAKNIVKTFKLSRQQKREMGDGFQGNTIDAVCDISFTCQPVASSRYWVPMAREKPPHCA